MNVDYFRYLALAGNFLNFRLCEIQLGAQCLLGEHGPLRLKFLTEAVDENSRLLYLSLSRLGLLLSSNFL